MEAEVSTNGYASTKSIQHLKSRLNEEQTVQAIDRLLDRIDVLEKAVNQFSMLMQQGPGLIAMTVDMADELYRKADAQGVNIENRLGAALHLAEKLTESAMVEKLDALMVLADRAPGILSMMVDSFDEEMKNMSAKNIDFNALASLAQNAAAAVGDANQMPIANVGGIFSMLRVMKDPDRQKAIGYFMNVAKAFGKKL
jgi:uncharacterized protein YjgD (DUF1641 family)